MAKRKGGDVLEVVDSEAPITYGVIRRDVRWFDLCEEMPGLQLQVWVNPPRSLRSNLYNGDVAEFMETVSKIMLAHNDWRYEDEDGEQKVIPQPSEPGWWESVPHNVSLAVIRRVIDITGELPNSLQREKSN